MPTQHDNHLTTQIPEATCNPFHQETRNAYLPDELLNDTQTAKILGLAKGTLAVWRVKGKGPAYVKIGANVRYRYASIIAYIDANTQHN
jgi:hypothetical protein